MKGKILIMTLTFILAFVMSCDEPETIVTNIVHIDGSVSRKILMRSFENDFDISDIQVPFDSTWIVRDSLEIIESGDTIWVRRAEKDFSSIVEINSAYSADSGANREFSRRAGFTKKFRWFNTGYRFTETVDKVVSNGYPVSDFLDGDELGWFYLPDNIKDDKMNGIDSLLYRVLNDTIDKKTDEWLTRSLISEWIYAFSGLTAGRAGDDLSADSLKLREADFAELLLENEEEFDSLWNNGILLKQFIGEPYAERFKAEADSAVSLLEEIFWVDFSDYTMRIVMPGRMTASNGFIDSTGTVQWPVKSDFFLTQQYEMWSESRIPNIWAWVISAAFLLFVIAGIVFKSIKRG